MATAKITGLALPCPKCGACSEPRLDMNLNNFEEITCGECGGEFTARQASAQFAAWAKRWQAVTEWLEAAPIGS